MLNLKAFFLGILGACGALILQVVFFLVFALFQNSASQLSLADFFTMPLFILAIAIIEELFKYFLIFKQAQLAYSPKILSQSIAVAIGFLAVEFFLIFNAKTFLSFEKLAGIAILHLGTCILFGQPAKGKVTSFAILFFAIGVHFFYNLSLTEINQALAGKAFYFLSLLILLNFSLFFRTNKRLAQD